MLRRSQQLPGHRKIILIFGIAFALWVTSVQPAAVNRYADAQKLETRTPIKNLIVLFEENEAFDKIFGTYPYAANPPDEKSPRFFGKVGNKAPANYLKLADNGYPVDLEGKRIVEFTQASRPQFNDLIHNNPNEIAPFRQGFNTYACYNSHQYNDELWAYGVWKEDSASAGSRGLNAFVKNTGLGYGGSVVLNNLQFAERAIFDENSPYWRQRLGWGCYGPPNDRRNVYNGAGDPLSEKSVFPESELMSGDRRYYTLRGAGVMGYWDGNTVQALWRYAQRYSMSDNFHQQTYGPSTLGHLSLVYGTTGPLDKSYTGKLYLIAEDLIDLVTQDQDGNDYMVSDLNPALEICENKDADDIGKSRGATVGMTPKNIGDLLSEKGISWGWFAGGFRLPSGKESCLSSGTNQYGAEWPAYTPGTQPFQYSSSTANPLHTPPAADERIGSDGVANHQYDLKDFVYSLENDQLAAVTFLKPKAHQDGHGDLSSPLDEQNWLVNIINKIQQSPAYGRGDVAILIAEDDSDGSYDHVMLEPAKKYSNHTMFGPGPRLVFLAISPHSRQNHVDSEVTDQVSIMKFIKYNWNLGIEPLNQYSTENDSGSILGMFEFSRPADATPLLLYCDGSIYDGSTGTPAPTFQTTSGRVSKGENSAEVYRDRKLEPGAQFSNTANLLIRKEGYKTAAGNFECANQFGY